MAVALVASTLVASATPARPGYMVKTQADGTKLTLSLMGSDEDLKIGQTVDGYTLLPDANGIYCYATLDKNGDLVKSSVKASDVQKRGAAEKAFVAKLAKALKFSAAQMKGGKSNPTPQNQWNQNVLSGNVRILAILMSYKNLAWTASTTTLSNMFNQTGFTGPTAGQGNGCFREYFLSMSGGLLSYTVDIKGPFTAANRLQYYGQNVGLAGADKHSAGLYDEALVKADPTTNFALYDNDNNGTVDPVILIHAGYDEVWGGDAALIWSSALTLANDYPWGLPPRTVDGKQAFKFCVLSEYRGVSSGTVPYPLGVFVHEYAHCMGTFDSYQWSVGPHCWDVMAFGTWGGVDGDHPTGFSACHKIFWGWVTPTVLSSPATGVTIANRNDNRVADKVVNAATGQYFLLENVKLTGWDAFCFNSGLLITHLVGDGTDVASHLEHADNSASCDFSGHAGDVFPGPTSNTAFTDSSTPNAKSTTGVDTGKPITNITYPSYVSTFDFMQ
jgi:M6 family metalloprotease-like protein